MHFSNSVVALASLLISGSSAAHLRVRDAAVNATDAAPAISSFFDLLLAAPAVQVGAPADLDSAVAQETIGSTTPANAIVASANITDVQSLNATVVSVTSSGTKSAKRAAANAVASYAEVVINHAAAIQSSDYMAFTVFGYTDEDAACSADEQCAEYCAATAGCNSFNVYEELNNPSLAKYGAVTRKCSLFSTFNDASTATNFGGQNLGAANKALTVIQDSYLYNANTYNPHCPTGVTCTSIGSCALNAPSGYIGATVLSFYDYSACYTACASTKGCVYANIWQDRITDEYTENNSRRGSTVCSFYSSAAPAVSMASKYATNCGPQDYPNGRHHTSNSAVIYKS